jgi:tetratricopeptide (TPR) repeat protein
MQKLPLDRPARGSLARALTCLALVLTAGCAAASAAPPSPSELRSLEVRAQRNPDDVEAAVRLGAGYRAAGRYPEAAEVLEGALQRAPDNPDVVLHLGLNYEAQSDWGRARELYVRYGEIGSDPRLRRDLTRRLRMLERRELENDIREALAQEATLANTPPQARTVAVFPFRFAATDSTLEPLGRAMAELLTTDLSQTDRLTVLERLRVQLLLDEIALGATALVDSSTAARGGRLLGAERVVQGTVGGGDAEVRLDAAVVQVTGAIYTGAPGASQAVQTLSEVDALERFFDVEKRLALRLYESMGIELTAAERERINRRPTENLQALLAYGRGLQALDSGDPAAAAQRFAEARALDSNFAEAAAMAVQSRDLLAVSRTSVDQLAQRALIDLGAELDLVESLIPDPSGRDATTEVLGAEGQLRPSIIELIIRRPSGN